MADFLQIIYQLEKDHWFGLLLGFLVVLLYWFCVAPFSVFKKLGINGPKPIPFFGNSWGSTLNRNNRPKIHQEWCKKYGKVFGMYLFRQPFLVVADPDMIREILVKDFRKFHDRKTVIEFPKPYDKMLTNVSGQKWKDIRNTLTPTFSASKMKQMMTFMNEALDTLMEKVDRISKTGEIVDFHRWLQSLTMEVILSTAFGVKAETQTVENDSITELAKKAMAPHPFIGIMLLMPFGDRLLKYFPDPLDFNKIGSVAASIIAERTKGKSNVRKDLLQLMLDAKDETEGGKIDNEDIQAQSVVFLLAGYETSSTTVGFVCYHLAIETHVQVKLRDEIDRMWPEDEVSPSYDVLHKMEYLDMVIKEALRMYPPAFTLQRECKENCTIKGVTIPEGIGILIPSYAIHHDPETYPDPEKFDPERFTEAEKARRHPYTYMPFGHGPHNCVGMRFALVEIKLTLVRLLKKYKLERTEKTALCMQPRLYKQQTCACNEPTAATDLYATDYFTSREVAPRRPRKREKTREIYRFYHSQQPTSQKQLFSCNYFTFTQTTAKMAEFLQTILQFEKDHWVALLVGFLVVLFYWYCVAPFTVFMKLGIKGPRPLPFFGNSLRNLFDPNVLPKLHVEWYKKYGKVFGIYFFRQHMLMVADPDMLKDILVKDFSKFHDRKPIVEIPKPYDKMLTIASGQKWKDIRNTLTPTFSASKMKLMMTFMNQALDTFVSKVDNISKTGETVDFHRWLQSLTMEVILSTAFGVKAETQTVENDPITELAKKAMAPHPLVAFVLLLPFGDRLFKYLPDPLDFDKIGSVAANIIAERTKANGNGSGQRKDMLQMMLDAKEETGGEKIDNEDIQAQSVVFLLAGYETSSTTLGFVCYHLAFDSHVQDKLRDEIDRMWPGNEASPSYDVLHRMEYLDMVINEALRMYPPGFAIQRDCNETCTIKGVTIPQGMPILVPCYAIHHDPEIYPDPEKFDPERFTEAEKAKRHPYTYLPFGHGPHNCVGMRFALLEIKLTLVRLLKKYKLERTEKTAVPLGYVVGSVLTCPPGKILLKVSPRD
ncbi:uncharacterized protein LOC111321343 [Stylophora pistillata]|uniref:uncharacterized protein LOC111321343 n=1 Tax=Stylophora pistillata TaxID=50429 RepID=UPI000C05138A|nr:uncharacterized protein LOC111321343 [Stylophora pistillata]